MAARMLGQGKNTWQAEREAAAELVDFLRFNVRYAEELYNHQPTIHSPGVWNRLEYRPLEGYVYAISPFNFTAIDPNLASVPALMGNVVVWKLSDYAVASNYLVHQILLEACLSNGVIQFVPGNAAEVTKVVLAHPEFAALHFTGSTEVFRQLYGDVERGIAEGKYKSYPRIVGETGGKNFHLIHKSADIDNTVYQTILGAFEYQGQKRSACSRVYVPSSIANMFKAKLIAEIQNLRGPTGEAGELSGGKYDDTQGWYIEPTLYEVKDPYHKNMKTEFFGPALHLYVYDDSQPPGFEDACKLADSTTTYGLTGAIFAQDRGAIRYAEQTLRNSAGNFYINGECTGAVVDQQPFGSTRASGTNDKAGLQALLSRFVSMRTIKEDLLPIERVAYPSNDV